MNMSSPSPGWTRGKIIRQVDEADRTNPISYQASARPPLNCIFRSFSNSNSSARISPCVFVQNICRKLSDKSSANNS